MLKDQFLNKMLEIDTWKPQSDDVLICEKLIVRLDEIIQCVLAGCKPIPPETNEALQVMLLSFFLLNSNFEVSKVFGHQSILKVKML